MKRTHNEYIDINSLVYSLALICHIFNKTEIVAGIKLFYVPAVLAFIITIMRFRARDKIQVLVYLFALSTFLGSAVSPNEKAIGSAVTFCVVIISTLGLRYIDARKLVITTNLFIPIVLVALFQLYKYGGYFRFEGYYNDPNYLCASLLTLLYIIILGMRYTEKKVFQIIMIVEIILIVIFTGITASRTGAICISLLLIGSYLSFLKRYFGYAIIITSLLLGYVLYSNPEPLQNIQKIYELRAQQNDTFKSASEYRKDLSFIGIHYIMNHPEYLPLGIGSGGTSHPQSYANYPHTGHGDHNSWSSCFTEHGLIGFLCFVLILAAIINEQVKKRKKNQSNDNLNLIAAMCILLFSLSVSMMLYLPFWWFIFLISNITNENSSYSLLRSK